MDNKKSLNGKNTLVTGASSGIGRAAADFFAREGANVALVARREERLNEIAEALEKKHDIDALVVPTDVRKDEQVDSAIEKTVKEFGSLDVVVSNAGVGAEGELEELSNKDYKRITETNVDGMFYVTRAALPYLRKTNGNLIFVGSFSGKYPRPHHPVYAATKWWTQGFALSVGARVGEDGVGVTIVNPAEVRTEIRGKDGKRLVDTYEEGEVIEPEELAEAILDAAKKDRSHYSEINFHWRGKLSSVFQPSDD